MTAWAVTVGFCAGLVAAGWWWAAALAPVRLPAVARAGIAYLAGAALVTLGMLLVAAAGLAVTRTAVLGCIGASALTGALVLRVSEPRRARDPVPGGSRGVTAALLGVAAVSLALGLLPAFLLGPVDHIDFARAWGLKAIAVFAGHDMRFEGVSRHWRFYPLELSNLYAAVWLLLGRPDETVIRLPLALFGPSLAAAVWGLCRVALPATAAALAVLLAVATPQLVGAMTLGLADLPAACYLTVAAVAAFLWLRDREPGWAAVSGFAAGAAAWTKLEGIPTALVILLGVVAVERSLRPRGVGRWLLWFAAFVLPWQVYQRTHDIHFARAHFRRTFLDVGWIAENVGRNLLDTGTWGVFWGACLGVVAVTAPLWWRTEWRLLAAVTLPNVVVTAAAYVIHHRAGVPESVDATASRLYLHIAPAVAIMTAAAALVAWREAAPWVEARLARAGGRAPPAAAIRIIARVTGRSRC